jgi:undecaprenyl diphosphate synthase
MAVKENITISMDDRLKHIAIIMDGNGRWATGRGMPREIGHRYGAAAMRKIVEYCGNIGLKTLTLYAFSTENWKRPEKEVNSILSLLRQYIADCEKNKQKYNAHFRFIGDLSVIDGELRERIGRLDEQTKDRTFTLNIAFNYGGRSEIVRAFRQLQEKGKQEITEQDISDEMYTSFCGDPDLIIRTGGDMRISNFLLWQAAYAELYFTDVLWPDFNETELNRAIENFYLRKRRYGGV